MKNRFYMKLGPLQTSWINKLKFGRYDQTTGSLHVLNRGKHSFCCLGVAACKVLVPAGLANKSTPVDEEEMAIEISYNGDNAALVRYSKLGLNSHIGKINQKLFKSMTHAEYGGILDLMTKPALYRVLSDRYKNRDDLSLAGMNDDLKLPFVNIAKILETFPKLYFTKSV